MSWLSSFFRKESTKVILKSALAILKVFAGKSADLLWERTTVLVSQAEETGLDGKGKAKFVADGIKGQWVDIKDHLVNLLVELAVAYLKEGLLKR